MQESADEIAARKQRDHNKYEDADDANATSAEATKTTAAKTIATA
jgi:hypothetical protein